MLKKIKKDLENEKNRLENLKELLRAIQDYESLQSFLEHVALATSIDQEGRCKNKSHDNACSKRIGI